MPQFGDFIMEPSVTDSNYISLDWREIDSDHIFSVNQISDGALRFIALATLLLQPAKSMPSLIVIDEPELGLHPAAISILSGMIKKAYETSQVVVATQSRTCSTSSAQIKLWSSKGMKPDGPPFFAN